MSKLCQSCHHENLDIAIYCAKCGNKIRVKTTDKASSSSSEKEKNIDTKLIRQIQIGIFSVIAFIVISFIIFNYFSKVRSQSYYSTKKDTNLMQTREVIKEEQTIAQKEEVKEKVKNISTNTNTTKENVSNKWECNVRWIMDKGKKYKPTNANLQTLSIELINKADRLHLKTQNGESKYNYSSFIDSYADNLGVEYTYVNRFIGIFQDGTLLMGDIEDGIDAKYYCKDMVLDIKKIINIPKPSPIQTINNVTKKEVKPIVSIEKFSLTIKKIPSDSEVRFLNIKSKYYDGIKLKKGNYHIEISKKGYISDDGWVEINEDTNLSITLDKIIKVIDMFSLNITTVPSNTQIKILNIKPKYHNGIKLKKGKYHIKVSKKGYRTIDKWITLKQNENFNFELEKIKKYIAPKVIQDEHTTSYDSYSSPKVIKYEEPINNYSNPKRMSKKERENLNTCLKGYLISSCKHSWLTSQQAIEVKRAERREGN